MQVVLSEICKLLSKAHARLSVSFLKIVPGRFTYVEYCTMFCIAHSLRETQVDCIENHVMVDNYKRHKADGISDPMNQRLGEHKEEMKPWEHEI